MVTGINFRKQLARRCLVVLFYVALVLSPICYVLYRRHHAYLALVAFCLALVPYGYFVLSRFGSFFEGGVMEALVDERQVAMRNLAYYRAYWWVFLALCLGGFFSIFTDLPIWYPWTECDFVAVHAAFLLAIPSLPLALSARWESDLLDESEESTTPDPPRLQEEGPEREKL